MQFRDGSIKKRDGSYGRNGGPAMQKNSPHKKMPPVWGIPEKGKIAADVGNLLICNSCQTPVLEVVKTLHKSEIVNDQISPTFFRFLDGKEVRPLTSVQCPKCYLTSPENKQFSSLCIIDRDSLEKSNKKFQSVSILQMISYMFTGVLKDQLRRKNEVFQCKEEILNRIVDAPQNPVKNSRKLKDLSHKELVDKFFILLNSKSKTTSEFSIHKYEEQDMLQDVWSEYKRRFCHSIAQKLIDGDITQNQLPTIIKVETGDIDLGKKILTIVKSQLENELANESEGTD